MIADNKNMQLFSILAYLIIIFIFVTPVPIEIRLVFNKNIKNSSFFIRFFNKVAKIPKTSKKSSKKKSKMGIKFDINKLKSSKIRFENFRLEVAVPKSFCPPLNYSLLFILHSLDYILSQYIYNWYLDKSYINYVVSPNDKLYFQLKADTKINLFIIFSVFFQTITIYRRKYGSN